MKFPQFITREPMQTVIFCALLCVLGAAIPSSQERITLSAPVFVSSGVSDFRVWVLELRRSHPDRPAGILAIFREVNDSGVFLGGGRALECRYEGDEADSRIIAL